MRKKKSDVLKLTPKIESKDKIVKSMIILPGELKIEKGRSKKLGLTHLCLECSCKNFCQSDGDLLGLMQETKSGGTCSRKQKDTLTFNECETAVQQDI